MLRSRTSSRARWADLSGGERQRVALGRALISALACCCSTSRSPDSTATCAAGCSTTCDGCATNSRCRCSTSPTTPATPRRSPPKSCVLDRGRLMARGSAAEMLELDPDALRLRSRIPWPPRPGERAARPDRRYILGRDVPHRAGRRSGHPLPWAAFLAVLVAVLALDLGVLNRKAHTIRPREAALWTLVCVALSLGFNAWIYVAHGRQPALEFLTGYVVEYALVGRQSLRLPDPLQLLRGARRSSSTASCSGASSAPSRCAPCSSSWARR